MKQGKLNKVASPHDWFKLEKDEAYFRWRDGKRLAYPLRFNQLVVNISDVENLRSEEVAQCQTLLDRYNMFVYRTPDESENKQIPLMLGRIFGLQALDRNIGAGEDGVTEIEVKSEGVHGRYVPYTSNSLNWHTDGYYNSSDRQIRAMALHCVRPSNEGGNNALLDPEMAYIYLRDLNPDFIRALSSPDTMTIPDNINKGKLVRVSQTGPVFSFDQHGNLHMRYSARKRSILWKSSPTLDAAREALDSLLQGEEWIFRGTLGAGEGLICNNVLHNRSKIEDGASEARLLYRLRYYDRASNNQPTELVR